MELLQIIFVKTVNVYLLKGDHLVFKIFRCKQEALAEAATYQCVCKPGCAGPIDQSGHCICLYLILIGCDVITYPRMSQMSPLLSVHFAVGHRRGLSLLLHTYLLLLQGNLL